MPLKYASSILLPVEHVDGVTCVAFSPSGLLLASGGKRGELCVWRVEDGALLLSMPGESSVLSVAWEAPKDTRVFFGLQDGTIVSLSLSEECVRLVGALAHKYPVEHLSYESGKKLLATGAQRELRVLKALGDQHQIESDIPPPPSVRSRQELLVTGVHWTAFGSLPLVLLVSYMHHGIVLYEPTTSVIIRSIVTGGLIASLAVSPDARYFAVSNIQRGFDIYDVESQTLVHTLSHAVGLTHPTPVLFLHQGRALAGGTTTGDVHLWDVRSGRHLHSLRFSGDSVLVLTLSAHYNHHSDTFRLATGALNDNPNLIIWTARSEGSEVNTPLMARNILIVAIVVLLAALPIFLLRNRGEMQ